ncbi:hypothetical protein NQ315_017469 [Exocentrus adspersus]|uniref:Reverse transcriptase domain-containing protein n=1 Tax=Exocentrus adspersus TaxID=1586481 RepID=A0AAV8VJK7_9CUCU|nr:hypothetical protein NQ315_017469 [Exocentrus adspersus]
MTSGVPQGSCLGPLIWNIQYNELCALPLGDGAALIAYADDVCVVCSAKEEDQLIRVVNETLERIVSWMRDAGLELALHKTDAILVKGRRTWQGGQFRIGNVPISITTEVKYLGVWLDSNLSFSKHIQEAAGKAERAANALVRLMPNVGGPGMAKRKIIAASAQSIMLYGAEIWATATEVDSYRQRLASVQRRILLRVVAAYKTVAEDVVQVLAGVPPIDLLAKERQDVYKHGIIKKEAKETTMRIWQRRWRTGTTGEWTRRLIKDVKKWTSRKHGTVGYRLTQWLTGHGSFGAYRRKIGKSETATCYHCDRGQDDTAEHTLFRCPARLAARDRVERKLRRIIHMDNIVDVMLEGEEQWKTISEWIEGIMKEKEEEEWRREGRRL